MRIGLLGGSFNPIHNGHLAIARAALECLRLDRVLFLPAAEPPHKRRGLLPYELRLQLVAQSVAPTPEFVASDLDRATDTPNYTFHLIQRVRAIYSDADLFFIIGEDNLAELPTWYRWQELLRTVTFAVVTRKRGKPVPPELTDFVIPVPMKPVCISSTAIRRRLHQGLPLGNRVPLPVEQFLQQHPGIFNERP